MCRHYDLLLNFIIIILISGRRYCVRKENEERVNLKRLFSAETIKMASKKKKKSGKLNNGEEQEQQKPH